MAKISVTLLLDETGSMEPIRDDTIGGFNNYLGTLKDLPDEVRFTFLKFDSRRVEKVHVGVPVADVPELNRDTYRPGAWTPLYDAAVKAIRATADVVEGFDKVIVVIQTDGQENASREFTQRDLADLIKEKTEAGWEFVFLGAGIDSYAEAKGLGIGARNTVSYNIQASGQAFAALAATTRSYVGGQSLNMGFDDDAKLAVGDVFDPILNARKDPDPAPQPVRPAVPDDDVKVRPIVDNIVLQPTSDPMGGSQDTGASASFGSFPD